MTRVPQTNCDPGDFADTLICMTMTEDRDVASKRAKNAKLVSKAPDRMLARFE